MVLIDRISCSDRLEAEKIERQYIETLKGTLNMRIPTRTQAEHYQDNKEHILMKNKEYRDRNKDAITDYTRKFYAEHKDEIISNTN
jgi:hypothetical protein